MVGIAKIMRDYLVFVRAGKSSLHSELIRSDPNRNWDCCVSWYTEPTKNSLGEYHSREGINKYEGFIDDYNAFLKDKNYKRLALIDDDVQFRPGDISRLFDYCDNENIELCQPALCWGTNASHNVTLWNPLFNRRNVTFIEVMTPFFSIDMLNQLMPTFNLTKSTYGIDYAWSSILSGGGKIAIVDKIKVNHIKAIDQKKGAFYNYLRAMGVDAFEDYEGVKELYGFEDGFKTLREDHVFRWFIPDFIGCYMIDCSEYLKVSCHEKIVYMKKVIKKLRKCVFSKGS